MSGERRGRGRELDVMRWYRQRGYVAYRLAWGNADVIALKTGEPTLLVQVKSTARAFERFGPRDRALLLVEAARADAHAVLAWWPAYGDLTIVPSEAWPPPPSWVADELAEAVS